MACSRHAPPAVRRSPAPSKTIVFTLYWRPLQKNLLFLLATTLVIPGCRRSPPPLPLFEAVTPEASGITFANTLSQDSVLNIVNYLYYYNGGGGAGGEIHGYGLLGLYFTSNLGRNRLYRNFGHFPFEDNTDRARGPGFVGGKSGGHTAHGHRGWR